MRHLVQRTRSLRVILRGCLHHHRHPRRPCRHRRRRQRHQPSPTKPSSTHSYTRPRSLLMLQREVDFVPATPKKSHVSRLSVDPLRPLTIPNSPFKNFRAVPESSDKMNSASFHESDGTAVGGEQNIAFTKLGNRDTVKTTEQKKEFLGSMLGNVDALGRGCEARWSMGSSLVTLLYIFCFNHADQGLPTRVPSAPLARLGNQIYYLLIRGWSLVNVAPKGTTRIWRGWSRSTELH
ncbi:hypothetical protein EDB92DRAFT_922736 [Lactarius akahatsu]|uniref:Uncharacterized protein n=1 Tax=Lactarius akahatsu TaxID=416441 RepID=A0AAD4QEI1_9AGAM|nr:hypothetical protein EDB92DRAFT_922736 [Lactarius akahatsu]